jgi:hypothetical protein
MSVAERLLASEEELFMEVGSCSIKGRDSFIDLGVGGNVILKSILDKYNVSI